MNSVLSLALMLNPPVDGTGMKERNEIFPLLYEKRAESVEVTLFVENLKLKLKFPGHVERYATGALTCRHVRMPADLLDPFRKRAKLAGALLDLVDV